MVDAAVSVFTEKLADLLIYEARFLGGVKGDVQRLQTELNRMNCFLKDSDAKGGQDAGVNNYINQIRGVAYDAEDVIDDFLLKSYSRRKGIRGLLSRLTSCISLHKTGNQISSIYTRIQDISNSTHTYGIKLTTQDGCQSSNSARRIDRLRREYSHIEEEHEIIGLEGSTKNVMNELMKEESKLCVVSIVGMGGLGKTTLARKVYKHADVRRHFDCYSWSSIPQQLPRKDVLRGILKESTNGELGDMNEDELVKTLHGVLKEKRYLIVLDDIWDVEAWKLLKPAFPKGRSGSKVLFTTRNKEVALHADPGSSVIELPFLTKEEGWKLLHAKAFPRGFIDEHGSLAEFESIGKKIVNRCGGLPLAIVLLGGVLATKRPPHEWEAVERSIERQLNKLEEQDHVGVYNILALSYQELPFRLKQCFLYLSQFPEDFEIRKGRLIRMWIAEGFIQYHQESNDEKTMEDVGEEYLKELISRCMVQVSKRDSTGRGVKTCRIHDLMRDFCVKKAAEESFLAVIELYGGSNTKNSFSTTRSEATINPRRLAIRNAIFRYGRHLNCFVPEEDLHLRSLLNFNLAIALDINFVFEKLRHVRVLSIENLCYVKGKPKKNSNLLQLRYFRLRTDQKFKTKFIGNLKNLLALDLGRNGFFTSDVLWKLERLRYFRGKLGEDCRVDTLTQLVTLKYVYAKSLIKNDAMSKLTNLRSLEIRFQTKEEVELVIRSPIFSPGGFLRSLYLFMVKDGFSFPNLEQLSACHHLAKLHLEGPILEDIHYHRHSLEFLSMMSISKLQLFGSKLRLQDPMAILEKLPELRYLKLSDAYEGCKMVCSAYGFPKLEFLELSDQAKLEEWIVEENTMPCLNALHMRYLDRLKDIPFGLKFVKSLQELHLFKLKKEVADKIRVVNGVEGNEFHIVRHIPTIMIFY